MYVDQTSRSLFQHFFITRWDSITMIPSNLHVRKTLEGNENYLRVVQPCGSIIEIPRVLQAGENSNT